MAEEDERKPLSLNERLAQSLSRSRNEFRVRKVKLEGRRRLCKLSSRTPEGGSGSSGLSPGSSLREKEDGDVSNSMRDVLEDLSSRLETLRVENPQSRVMAAPAESALEFKSAESSLSPPSVEEGREKGIQEFKRKSDRTNVRKENEGKKLGVVEGKFAQVVILDEEDDCVVVGSSEKSRSEDDEDAKDLVGDNSWESIIMEGSGMCKTLRYRLPGKTANLLYPHQKEGLEWLWSLHCAGTGGILGDDMGLGKTMQVSAFLAGLFFSCLIRRVLVVAPKTLLGHWMKELTVVGLSSWIREYCGTSLRLREYELQKVFKDGGILLTTYDIVRNNSKSIRGDSYIDYNDGEDDVIWDYTILDEGHIIKNPQTQRAKSLFEIPSCHRIIISGTPIQNNLKELWALFHFCCPDILGSKDEFKIMYEYPILRGNDKHASDREKHVSSAVAKDLRERIKPYFLRRMKNEVFLADNTTKNAKLSRKNEIIVWLKLTSAQRQLYEAFLKSDLVRSSISGSPLAAITILKKICDHPLLLTKRAAEGVLEGMDTMLNREELGMVEEMALNLANMSNHDDILKVGENVSCKLSFIMSLLDSLIKERHHVLIFSQTRKMLNLVQEAIISEGYKFLRIDGTTKAQDREKIVKDFQEGCGAPIFLLTSQVGGLGLTLTKADRVIVLDPAWNPSTDNQSVDRAYRIGQKRDVLVYRLMTCGTVEEKIYKMQVFKGGLFRTATEQKEQTRYFSQRDMHELFSLPPQGFDISLTQQQLYEEHDEQHTLDDSLKSHIEFLRSKGIAGVSYHSLLFSKTATSIVQENSKLPRDMGDRIVQTPHSNSSIEYAVDVADFALKPKDGMFFSRPNTTVVPFKHKESPQEISERILRLSESLLNKVLVARLPDGGEKIRKQISELEARLEKLTT